MEYNRVQIGVYESDVSWTADIWRGRIAEMKKAGLIIETETKSIERWRVRPFGELDLKSKEMTKWGVRALYPLTFVYEVKRVEPTIE